MSAVRNYVAVPFFDRVPPRVTDLVRLTFDNIVERAQTVREAYHFFSNSVKKLGCEGPTHAEFADWHERVKNGLIERPHSSAALGIEISAVNPYKPQERGPEDRKLLKAIDHISSKAILGVSNASPKAVTTPAAGPVDPSIKRLTHARAIVAAAHQLNQVKLAAGHCPSSIPVEDAIVAEALREVLEADGDSVFTDPTSRALDAATALLIERSSEEQEHRLLDLLTMDMQVELCRKLVTTGSA
ncbi:hypothetical protein QE369_002953 [Agrobacterium larrymoorei]|uniref:Uncharacterized protein n=1 Tax=Agrobacterium larrymoorei TaxID=160699 RepID=A0AAJ2BGZ8_9HYPH|nr:hypothetical protein [Agrobacterium larrymoorei]MDR6102756.1 hypothetical protein [Agrobacterium larrymoorei]